MKTTPYYEIIDHLDSAPRPDWLAGAMTGNKRILTMGEDITDWIAWVSFTCFIDDDDEPCYVMNICHQRDGQQTIICCGQENIVKETDEAIYLNSPTPDEIIAEAEWARQEMAREDGFV
jgi:hypothetical protein